MRRHDPENLEIYWYEIVEVFYGSDRRPMMWTEASLPYVDSNDIEFQEEEIDDLETFVKESMKEQFASMAMDIVAKGPLLDERDFAPGGVYADHPEFKEMEYIISVLNSGDDQAIADLNLKKYDPDDPFWDDEDDDNQ